MEYLNESKKKFIECIENGIELDKEGHALLRMEQRKISFDTVRNSLRSYEKVEDIKAYKPESLKDAYRVFIKLTERKTLVVGVMLNGKCTVKTVFIQTKKIQKRVEKWRRKSR